MSEQRPQNWYLPLRVRFRSPSEQTQLKREASPVLGESPLPQLHPADAANDPGVVQRTRQVKELIRLGNILRAELGLNEVLQQIVASISACTGFRMAVINLVEDNSDKTSPVGFSGGSEEGGCLVRGNPLTWEQMHRLVRPWFRISRSYFIS